MPQTAPSPALSVTEKEGTVMSTPASSSAARPTPRRLRGSRYTSGSRKVTKRGKVA